MSTFTRALVRVADWSFVGLLVTLLSLPVLTVPAAVSAGLAASREDSWGEAWRAGWRRFRAVWVRSLVPGLVLAGAAGWGVALVVAAPVLPGVVESTATRAIGTLLCAAAVFATPFVATALGVPGRRGVPGALRLAVLAPVPGLIHLALMVGAVAAVAIFPLFALPVLGAAASRAATIPRIAARRLSATRAQPRGAAAMIGK